MGIKQGALITDSFKCPNPAFEASNMSLPYKVCIGRQITKTPYGEPLYTACADCKDGKDIRKHFRDYKYAEKVTKINVRNATSKRIKKGECPYSPHYVGKHTAPTPTSPPCQGGERERVLQGGDGEVKKGEGESMAIKEKPRCEVTGCPKGQWKERRCMVHYNEKHGIVKTGKWKKKNTPLHPSQEGTNKTAISSSSSKKHVPINKQCSILGCEKYAVKDRKCISHFKESLVCSPGGFIKPEKTRGVPHLLPALELADQIIKKDNGKNLCAGQLLYASELLDGQIESALDSGIVDRNILLNIRKRIGAVLRADLPAEVTV